MHSASWSRGRARQAARPGAGPGRGGAGLGGGAARWPRGGSGSNGLAGPDRSGSKAQPEPAMEQPRKAVVVTGTV